MSTTMSSPSTAQTSVQLVQSFPNAGDGLHRQRDRGYEGILGLCFKENCPDLRNTRVVDVVAALQRYCLEPVVVVPWVDPKAAQREYANSVLPTIPHASRYGAVIVAVDHRQFVEMSEFSWRQLLEFEGVLLDLMGLIPRALQPLRL